MARGKNAPAFGVRLSIVADLFLFALLALALPLASLSGRRRLERALVEAEDPGRLRVSVYWRMAAGEWLVAGLVLVVWLAGGRGAGDLGFAAPSGVAGGLGALVVAAVTALLLLQLRGVVTNPARADAAARALERSVPFAPRTPREAMQFGALALSAGICEEIAYRGFAIRYLQPAVGLVGAVFASAVVFGAAHLYQGSRGLLQSAAVGLLAGALFAASGSLAAPIALHVAIDMVGGATSAAAFRNRRRRGSNEPVRPVAGDSGVG